MPINETNMMIAKLEVLELLVEKGVIDKETALNIDNDSWCCAYLQDKWK